MARILGIDLGTTNSVMAVMEKNGPIIVPNSLGDRLTPSVVSFTKSGEMLVGKKARRAALMNVGRTVFSIKRHMGTNFRVKIDGKEYSPQEISGMILQKLKHDAEEYFGEEINQAVITVPAYFNDAQRQATKDSGEISGLKVRRIIDEPTAAALAYGLDREQDQTILVYDLGGGTYDVCIIEVISGVFQVLAIQGNTHLGGDDFDRRIVNYLLEQFKNKHDIDLSDDPIAMARLKERAEEAKIELSELKETHILIEAITMTDKGPITFDEVLTRTQFESLVDDLLQQTIPPMLQAIEDARLEIDKLDTILLVGGCTRIPAVQRIVKDTLKRNPHRDISPEEVVAVGAAVQTLILSPIEGEIEDTLAARYGREKPVIIHMTPFSLGVGLVNDQFGVIIERNSTYPTEAKDIFTTTRDFQEAVSFPVYEGDEPIASENTFLDLLRIEGITPAPRGVPRIEVTFKLNADRILEARAEDLATGVEKKITIAATGSKLNDADKARMIKEARERVNTMLRAKIQERREEEVVDILSRAERIIASNSDHPLAGELRKKAEQLKKSSVSGSEKDLDPLIDEVLRILTEVEMAAR